MKTHLNLATSDLEKSVAFYSTLLNDRPFKHLAGYALFVTEQPGIELALDLRDSVSIGHDVHYGVVVESTGDVERAIDRLRTAGFAIDVESDETCCYARQTKVWATDPEGRRWETYTVHEETEARDDAQTTCCSTQSGERSCCPA
jgi:catechol 2,3-dioxygenase-like lactoylglutathione lyase family enzyme